MKKLLFVTFISVILLSSCEWVLDWLLSESGTKTFWANDFVNNSNYRVTAELLAENDYCKVYAETANRVDKSVAQNMADEYIKIYNKMIGAFGSDFEVEYTNGKKGVLNTIKLADAYADGDGKLTILLLDIKDGYKKGVNDSYVAGYFYAGNFLDIDYSNLCDMIYVDTNPALKENPEDAYSTLAHELQHLMNFITSIEKRLVYDAKGEVTDIHLMDTWVDEGLSSAAEWVYTGKHLLDRWGWYYLNGDGESLIDRGNNFYVWGNREKKLNDPPDENKSLYAILDDYATVYLFFQWLRIQNNGAGIYKDIITSKYGDYNAVTSAASKFDSSYNNGNWEKLLGDWFAANYIYNPNGRYGYKNDFDFRKDGELLSIKGLHLLSTTKTSIILYPGEGVFSKINKSTGVTSPGSGPNIRYSLLTDTGFASGSTLSSGTLLTYNANPVNYENVYNAKGELTGKKDPPTEYGTITGVLANVNVAAPVNGRAVAAQFRINGPYRIGAGDVNRGFTSLPPAGVLRLPNIGISE